MLDLVDWVLLSKLPPQCLVLLCLLSILLRAVVQSWTAHFHSHHTHLLVVNKSPINHVRALRKQEHLSMLERRLTGTTG